MSSLDDRKLLGRLASGIAATCRHNVSLMDDRGMSTVLGGTVLHLEQKIVPDTRPHEPSQNGLLYVYAE